MLAIISVFVAGTIYWVPGWLCVLWWRFYFTVLYFFLCLFFYAFSLSEGMTTTKRPPFISNHSPPSFLIHSIDPNRAQLLPFHFISSHSICHLPFLSTCPAYVQTVWMFISLSQSTRIVWMIPSSSQHMSLLLFWSCSAVKYYFSGQGYQLSGIKNLFYAFGWLCELWITVWNCLSHSDWRLPSWLIILRLSVEPTLELLEIIKTKSRLKKRYTVSPKRFLAPKATYYNGA